MCCRVDSRKAPKARPSDAEAGLEAPVFRPIDHGATAGGDKVREFRAALPPGNTGRTFCQDFRVAAAILLAPANE